MQKINWENGTLISPAKVEIGGVIYDVTPEQYSGNTPLSAENLNQMEDNIEDAIEDVEDKLTPVTLFTGNVSGKNDINLSDAISNYEKLVIVGSVYDPINIDEYNTATIYPELQSRGELTINFSKNEYQYHYGCNLDLHTNKITISGGWAMVFADGGAVAGQFTNSNQINITKVIGYLK